MSGWESPRRPAPCFPVFVLAWLPLAVMAMERAATAFLLFSALSSALEAGCLSQSTASFSFVQTSGAFWAIKPAELGVGFKPNFLDISLHCSLDAVVLVSTSSVVACFTALSI